MYTWGLHMYTCELHTSVRMDGHACMQARDSCSSVHGCIRAWMRRRMCPRMQICFGSCVHVCTRTHKKTHTNTHTYTRMAVPGVSPHHDKRGIHWHMLPPSPHLQGFSSLPAVQKMQTPLMPLAQQPYNRVDQVCAVHCTPECVLLYVPLSSVLLTEHVYS